MKVLFTRLHSHDLPLPRYMTPGSSGLDLYAAVDEEILIPSGKIVLVPTGLAWPYRKDMKPRYAPAVDWP